MRLQGEPILTFTVVLPIITLIVGGFFGYWLDRFRRRDDRKIDFYTSKLRQYEALLFHLSDGGNQEKLAAMRKACLMASKPVYDDLKPLAKLGDDQLEKLVADMRCDLAECRKQFWRLEEEASRPGNRLAQAWRSLVG